MVFEEIIRSSPHRRASPRIAEGFSPTAMRYSGFNSQCNCSGMQLKPRLSGRFAPDDRLCGRRGSVHAGGRPAKSRPEAISIAERQGGRRGSVHAGGRPAKSRPEAISIAERQGGRRGSVHAGGRPAKSRPEAISIAQRQAA
jgi:hypothetical protein